jgi:hypothetical protein
LPYASSSGNEPELDDRTAATLGTAWLPDRHFDALGLNAVDEVPLSFGEAGRVCADGKSPANTVITRSFATAASRLNNQGDDERE